MELKNSVVVGTGEVGTSLHTALSVKIEGIKSHDLEGPPFPQAEEGVMHVCFPYDPKKDEEFIEAVQRWTEHHKPAVVVIHSTVAPRVTERLARPLFNKYGAYVYHSPVRGVHPHLAESILKFVKYLGPSEIAKTKEGERVTNALLQYFRKAGVRVRLMNSATATELAKLFSTDTYGLLIAWAQEQERICKRFGEDYQEVCEEWTETYNEGYLSVGMPHVRRPVMFPGIIGGHCVIPNAMITRQLLHDQFETPEKFGRLFGNKLVPTSMFIEAMLSSNIEKRKDEGVYYDEDPDSD